MENTATLTKLAKDVIEGLSSNPKHLHSKYFYDATGSKIFEQIMRMPEYYLTDCELEIFTKQKNEFCDDFITEGLAYDIIELGAGDGLKTRVLLGEMLQRNIDFTYIPIDISHQAIRQLQDRMRTELPGLKMDGRTGDYFRLITDLNSSRPKVVLFLGSNIGNFNQEKSMAFLKQLRESMKAGDKLLIGFDLKKDPEIILRAYNDPHGLTAAFNLNLLSRINHALDADFNISDFFHKETYDPETGTAKSFLVSRKDQVVVLKTPGESIHFTENESIFMEMSQKYDEDMISKLAHQTGFHFMKNYYDSRKWFVNSLWTI